MTRSFELSPTRLSLAVAAPEERPPAGQSEHGEHEDADE